MTSQERRAIVLKSKTEGQIVKGKYVDLFPCAPDHGATIVKLRNQEKSRSNLNQVNASTIESQAAWYSGYMLRGDDIYWCVHNKNGRMIGTVRLYNIDSDGNCCNQGSFIIDEECAMNGPYALETEILTLDFCFDALCMAKILNDDKVENKNMNSISRRIGFQLIQEFERDGARYNLYELTKDTYKRAALAKILAKWKDRE